MKHVLQRTLMLVLLIFGSMISIHAQTEVIAGWTFEATETADRIFADLGNANNTGENAQTITPVNINFTSYVQGSGGSGTFSKNSNGWPAAEGVEKYWQVRINTLGYDNLTVSSRQQSSGTGPRDFQVEFSLDGVVWTAIPNSSITTANNFTSGVLSPTPVPTEANNQGTVFLRWISTSNTSVGGNLIAATGTSRIDDIIIEGTILTGAPTDPEPEAPLLSTLASWDFAGQPGNQASTTGVGSESISAIDFTRGTGVTPTAAANSISGSAWSVSDVNDYFAFGITIEDGFEAKLSQLILATRSSGTGPGRLALRYSVDNFTSNLATWSNSGTAFSNETLDLSALETLTGSVEFRIYPNEDINANGATGIANAGTLRVANFAEGGGVFSPVRFLGIVTEEEQPEPITLIEYRFTGEPGNQVSTPGVSLDPGVEGIAISRGAGLGLTAAANSINSNGWNAGDDRFFTFGITVSPGQLVDLTELQIGTSSSNTGPRDMALVYSGDGFTSRLAEWQHTGTFVNQIIDLSSLQNLSGEVEFRIISTSNTSANGNTVASTGTSRVTNYFEGGNTGATRFIGIVKNAQGVVIPTIELTVDALDFGIVSLNSTPVSLSYQISGTNLTDAVSVVAPAGITISTDGNTFSNELLIPAAEVMATSTIFVQVETSQAGSINAQIAHSTEGTLPVSLTVTASILDPFNIVEDFNTICVANFSPISGGWSQVSVAGDQTWSCSNFGRAGTTPTANAPFGVQMNGFAAGTAVLNEDWLISPAYDLTAFDFPLLEFWSRVAFGGPRLKLKVSTDYVDGDPNLATWTELADRFAQGDTWTSSGEVNLSAFKAANVRIAFVYTSGPEVGAARWTIDDFSLRNSETAPAPFLTNSIGNVDYWHFGIVPVGSIAPQTRSFEFSLSDAIADLTISAGDGFEFSKDGVNFSSAITFSPEESGATQTVSIRFNPSSAGAFSSPIFFNSGDIQVRRGFLTGATVEKSKTLDVVTWNIEWFGSASNGPTNVNLQLENVKKVIEDLDADIYAFQEIASLSRFNQLVEALPGYGGVVSPATSAGGDFAEEAQKLTYLFKLETIDTLQTKVLLTGVTPDLLVDYPSGRDRFWASGRLPFLMEIQTKKNGVSKTINMINVHTRSNGGGESAANPRYAMRRYDVNVLKDTLDAHYADVPLIILGDFNDDLDETVANQDAPTVGTSETSFINYINDPENYNPITISLSNAGLRTFPTFENVIDHIIISNEMNESWLVNSERIYFPYDLIPAYDRTTSDHLPVKARFELICDLEVPQILGPDQLCSAEESSLFLIGGNFQSIVTWERSVDGISWESIEGSQGVDILPLQGISEATFFRVIVGSDSCFPQVSDAFEVTVKTLPTPVIYFERGLLTTIEGPYTFTWFKNGQLIASGSSNTTRINGAGLYEVEIQDADGCVSRSSTYRFPQQLTGNQVRVFPNPATQQVTITLRNTEGMVNIQLKTIFGSVVNQIVTSEGFAQFDVTGLAKGVYLIVVTNQQGSTTVQRLTVR
ncbi:T9SS-dependent choice-of-anchor J family protein [Mongoliitalea daihaiensis]|uniref:T9SS-dependent choice-of-anchor J family protein n=1 Tax=Mongoliitalea daihaiensis TaxID=2782006 RepID=UPI001F2EE687|nr:choice-of-anchor J domain-containing protein [Mongoliitalea daihaiensis]UJP64503.1 choice-of-anchor J domain-containing protein [Mongoliitalea daihaiensis]